MIEKSYAIGITPTDKEPPVIHVSRGDTDFQILLLITTSVGEFEIETGTTIELRGRKPDGGIYTNQCYLSSERTVLLQGDANLTDVAGRGVYELCFTHNSKWLHTANFIIQVEPSPAERN